MVECFFIEDAGLENVVDWLLNHTIDPVPVPNDSPDAPRIVMQPAEQGERTGSRQKVDIRGSYYGRPTPPEVLAYQEAVFRAILFNSIPPKPPQLPSPDERPGAVSASEPKTLEGKVSLTVEALGEKRVELSMECDEPALFLFWLHLYEDIRECFHVTGPTGYVPDSGLGSHHPALRYIDAFGSPAIEQEPRPTLPAAKSPRVPVRPRDKQKWRRCWALIKGQWQQCKNYEQISGWLARMHKEEKLDYSPDIVADIIKAGEAGLLD